jgi:hypothetical protein
MKESKRALATRRSFLKAVGAAAAALPFYKLLEDHAVRAEAGTLPLKLVGVGSFHCTTQQFYARQAGETDTSFDIGYADCALKPFDDAATYGRSFKNNLIIFEGFDYGVGEFDPSGGAMHVPMHGALGMFLTGSSANGGSGTDWNMQNASLDQVLAAQYGSATKFRSVELCTEIDFGGLESSRCIAYGVGGTPLSRLTDPSQIWDKYFANLVVSTDPAAQAAAARRQMIGQSVLDFVAGDIQRLNARLAGAEKQKLDQHLTVIRDLEKQLQADGGAMAAACSAPVRHDPKDSADPYIVSNGPNGGEPYFNKIADFQVELLAQILICDLARFATIVFAGTAGPGTMPQQVPVLDDTGTELAATGTDRLIADDFHNSIAHKSSSTTLAVQQAVSTVSRYYYGKVARLMQRLDEAGVLDSTLILCGNEGGHGAGHSTQHVPILLCGGANGALQMGKRVVCPGRTPQVGDYSTGAQLTSHNPILVSVANLFGANISSFGTCAKSAFTAGVTGLI